VTLAPGFLALPADDDPLVATLFARVRAVAWHRLATRPLPPALAVHQARLRRRHREPDGPAAITALFAEPDVLACALALDTPAYARRAAATLAERLDRAAPFSDDLVVTPTLGLATIDRNPLAELEAHPDKDGNALDLGGQPATAWITALADAVAAITAALPALGAELALTLRRVVPVGYDRERHLSCSYREAPGLVYLSLHPDGLTLAEAIVHETQHGKLHLLSWLDPLLDNPPTERVASPARPDPRPLMGVLLAAHALVPVAALHHALAAIDHPWAAPPNRRQQILAGNAEALATLAAHARPTALGAKVIAALVDLHAQLS